MATQTIIEWNHRHPTAKLAKAAIPHLPNCGWKVGQREGWYYLQFRCETAKAHRILQYLRGEYPGFKYTEYPVEQPDGVPV